MRSCLHRKQGFKSLAFFLGAFSLASQILLLREYVAAFQGNELVYALTLAVWLFWVGLGSMAVARCSFVFRSLKKSLAFVIIAGAILLPVNLWLVRIFKFILGIHAGELMGPISVLVGVVLTLAPVTLLLGAFFGLLCQWGWSQNTSAQGAKVYLWEAVGAAVGGTLVSLGLLPFLSDWQIALGLSFAGLLLGVFLYFPRRGALIMAFGAIAIFGIWGPLELGKTWEHKTQAAQWSGLAVVQEQDSVYGRLALLRVGEEISLYENGVLSFTINDVLASEERVHFAMLAHPSPERVLLIGGGVGGGLEQLLKYRTAHIDYLELDSSVVEMAQSYLPEAQVQPLYDPRVNSSFDDGRLFLKTAAVPYDVIIVAAVNPDTALVNRYYTKEFFMEARRALTPQGVLSLSLTASENYLNEETRALVRSIYTTLRTVFADVQVIPGDTNIFLACPTGGLLDFNSGTFAARLRSRGIQTQYVNDYYLPFKLSPDRREYLQNILSIPGQINSDSRPWAYLHAVLVWLTHFHNVDNKFLQLGLRFPAWGLGIIPVVLFVMGYAVQRRRRNGAISLAIVGAGFSGIIFQVIIVLAFQALYGQAYYRLGLIFAAFMLGLVGGSLLGVRLLPPPKSSLIKYFCAAQGGLVVYPFLLPLLFVVFRESTSSLMGLRLLKAIFIVMPVLAGFLGGLQFSLATRLPGNLSAGSRNTALLYGRDVWGASLGALATGAFLVPVFGINITAFLCAGINFAVLVLVLIYRKQCCDAKAGV